MGNKNLNGIKIDIPDLACGSIIPQEMQRLEMEKERRAAEKRAERRHDWAVAIVSAIIGAIAGGLAGYITALLTLKGGL